MKTIEESVIEAIKEAIDIVDYIGERIDLHRAGGNYTGLCPMHPDKNTESFSVDPRKGLWHCFGCSKSGDIISFQMEFYKQNFMEAVRSLAKFAEIDFNGEIELFKIDPWIKAMKLLSLPQPLKIDSLISEAAIEEFKKYQHENTRNEGWLEETIKIFEIGYCIDQYDYEFYDRITIPIRDANGKLVGLAGRKTNDEDELRTKYRFTYGFDKSNHLYGLNLALPEIRRTKQMIVTEGFHETWRSWEAGVRNVVAICGSKLDKLGLQKRLIMKYSRDIILAFDNDEAGQKGTMEIGEELNRFCRVRVTTIPKPYKDLGEIRDYELIQHIINTAKGI